MGKWQKIDPAEIRIGDKVRMVSREGSSKYTVEGIAPAAPNHTFVFIGGNRYLHQVGSFYIRKPKKAKPLTRPDEPPVGSFFRVDRTGIEWVRVGTWIHGYQLIPCDDEQRSWETITEPGDTLTMLELREVGK